MGVLLAWNLLFSPHFYTFMYQQGEIGQGALLEMKQEIKAYKDNLLET